MVHHALKQHRIEKNLQQAWKVSPEQQDRLWLNARESPNFEQLKDARKTGPEGGV